MPPDIAVSITISGLVMGSRTIGDDAIILTTSADMKPSNSCFSGGIFNKVFVETFYIANRDRVAGRKNISASFSFISTVQGTLVSNSRITLNYPLMLFAPSANLSVSISGGGTGNVSATSSSAFVITTFASTLQAGISVIITLHGLAMGSSPKGSSDGIFVETSADSDPSDAISSGMVGGEVSIGVFVISGMGRIVDKTVATVTFSFTPSVGGALAPGSTIMLRFSSGFLNPGNSSVASISHGAFATITAPSFTSIVITTSHATLPSSNMITVTMVGVIVDSANGASSGGVVISTSADVLPVSYWGGCSCDLSPVVGNSFCEALQ
jgi:hypothetical protein